MLEDIVLIIKKIAVGIIVALVPFLLCLAGLWLVHYLL